MSRKNVFLLLGPEEGEKRVVIKNHISKKTEELGERPEILKFYSFESKMVDIISILQNESLFSKYTVLILYNVEVIKRGDEQKILVEYLCNPSDTATLFLLSTQIQQVSKPIVDAIPEQNKKIFWELAENRKRNWIQTFFRGRNIKIEPSALEFLIEMVENNTRDLKSTCNKLALFFGPDSVIRDEGLEKYVYHSKEENVFTLFERIAGRDFPASIEILHKILLSGESDGIMITSGLLWQIRKLLAVKLLIQKNFHINEIFKRLKIWSKKNQHVYTQANRAYTEKEIVSIIILISDFNVAFRSVKTDIHTTLLYFLIYYIVKQGGSRTKGKDFLY